MVARIAVMLHMAMVPLASATFLRVEQDDPQTLHYHKCMTHREGCDGNEADHRLNTAVVQPASFCASAC